MTTAVQRGAICQGCEDRGATARNEIACDGEMRNQEREEGKEEEKKKKKRMMILKEKTKTIKRSTGDQPGGGERWEEDSARNVREQKGRRAGDQKLGESAAGIEESGSGERGCKSE